MKTQGQDTHEQCWLVLPWLATGRLGAGERAQAEEHLRSCSACSAELERQHLLRTALTEPERVSHAPGPAFRKLMERIDTQVPVRSAAVPQAVARRRRLGPVLAASWRPPGLAWAATFVFALGAGIMAPTLYRWSQPAYSTYTSSPRARGDVLHIAFERSLTVGEVTELLASSGARIVEGPDSSGIFGVAPVRPRLHAAGEPAAQLHQLATRLHGDPRVRWIEPLPQADAPGPTPAQP